MQTLANSTVADDRQLRRLVDRRASIEAAGALHAAAVRTTDPKLARILTVSDEWVATGTDAARDRLLNVIVSAEFVPVLRDWIRELREVASAWPDSGACTVATALTLTSWTLEHFRNAHRQALDEVAVAISPLIAARALVLDVVDDATPLRMDLSHVYAAHVSSAAAAACAELVFGYRRHLTWDAEGCATCYSGDDLDDLEQFIPGIASGTRSIKGVDVIEADGSHPAKRGPCVKYDGIDSFVRLRQRLDGCLTGARVAKDRAATILARRS